MAYRWLSTVYRLFKTCRNLKNSVLFLDYKQTNVAVKNLKIKVFILVGITVDKLSRKILVCVPIDEKQES